MEDVTSFWESSRCITVPETQSKEVWLLPLQCSLISGCFYNKQDTNPPPPPFFYTNFKWGCFYNNKDTPSPPPPQHKLQVRLFLQQGYPPPPKHKLQAKLFLQRMGVAPLPQQKFQIRLFVQWIGIPFSLTQPSSQGRWRAYWNQNHRTASPLLKQLKHQCQVVTCYTLTNRKNKNSTDLSL